MGIAGRSRINLLEELGMGDLEEMKESAIFIVFYLLRLGRPNTSVVIIFKQP